MKKAFYDREKEVALLRATREKSKTSHSMMTVLTGRRRIGKTSLGRQILSDDVGIYLFVGRKDEATVTRYIPTMVYHFFSIFVP